jgi:hypothetical protein
MSDVGWAAGFFSASCYAFVRLVCLVVHDVFN